MGEKLGTLGVAEVTAPIFVLDVESLAKMAWVLVLNRGRICTIFLALEGGEEYHVVICKCNTTALKLFERIYFPH